jgi:hypothetical protein
MLQASQTLGHSLRERRHIIDATYNILEQSRLLNAQVEQYAAAPLEELPLEAKQAQLHYGELQETLRTQAALLERNLEVERRWHRALEQTVASTTMRIVDIKAQAIDREIDKLVRDLRDELALYEEYKVLFADVERAGKAFIALPNRATHTTLEVAHEAYLSFLNKARKLEERFRSHLAPIAAKSKVKSALLFTAAMSTGAIGFLYTVAGTLGADRDAYDNSQSTLALLIGLGIMGIAAILYGAADRHSDKIYGQQSAQIKKLPR